MPYSHRLFPIESKLDMRLDALEEFGAYALAMKLFDSVVEDMRTVADDPRLDRLSSQLLGSADSIAANIEEGYGRETKKEYIRFLMIARGLARETKGCYVRLRDWLPSEVVEDCCGRCEHIIGILTNSIKSLRQSM